MENTFNELWFSDELNSYRRGFLEGRVINNVCLSCNNKPKKSYVKNDRDVLWNKYLEVKQ